MASIRVILPYHLRNLIFNHEELIFELTAPVTIGKVLDSLETSYPQLRGTIRDHTSKARRPFIRYFACKEDYSNDPVDKELPCEVLESREPFLIVGAMAGG